MELECKRKFTKILPSSQSLTTSGEEFLLGWFGDYLPMQTSGDAHHHGLVKEAPTKAKIVSSKRKFDL